MSGQRKVGDSGDIAVERITCTWEGIHSFTSVLEDSKIHQVTICLTAMTCTVFLFFPFLNLLASYRNPTFFPAKLVYSDWRTKYSPVKLLPMVLQNVPYE